jgi:hypothetical protein
MAVYRPKRNGTASKFYVCEFVLHGKRIQESTGATSKTVAKEYEKRRRMELERAAAGLPTEEKAPRLRTVAEVADRYVQGYKLNTVPNRFYLPRGGLNRRSAYLETALLSDLTEERIRQYIRQRCAEKASGRTVNMELGELYLERLARTWHELWPKVRKLEE